MTTQQIVEKFKSNPKYLRNGAGFLAKQWNCSISNIYEAKDLIRAEKQPNSVSAVHKDVAEEKSVKFEEDFKNNSATLDYKGPKEVKTKEDLIRECNIDLSKWDIIKMVHNAWGKEGNQNHQVKAWLAPIKDAFSEELFMDFLKTYKSAVNLVKLKQTITGGKETVDVVISLADFHIDKLDVIVEDVEVKVELYMKVLRELLANCANAFNINKIVFVIGNDLFQTDTIQSTTTSGTIVSSSITWNKAYEMGFDLMVNAITEVFSVSRDVDVVLVQGNHARTKEYYLAHALEVYFKSYKEIKFFREFTNVKHFVLGNTFVGLHHGNTKLESLPLVFATNVESSYDFGRSKFREIVVGDKHHTLVKEMNGVRVRQMPSLSGTDLWHLDGNFVNSRRCGVAIVYHPTKGKCAEFESGI